ncbi:MAG: peptidase [Gammaproteobacteria bacterium]|nr:peptidase [Gammaproteobacteria bacterium]
MTYCVGVMVDEGMVLLSDTRTNAGFDNISTFKKTFTYEQPGERVIVIMSAGSLSITQTVIAKLEEAIEDQEPSPSTSFMHAPTILQSAEIIGNMLSEVSAGIKQKMARMEQSATASFIVAGQRSGGEQRMFLIYPEGNFIEATDDSPFLQIGEHKYGKPILDRVILPDTSLEDAGKATLLSMDSTLRSNLSVGMPLDLTVIKNGACKVDKHYRIEAGNRGFTAMSEAWSETLRDGFRAMPSMADVDAENTSE